jgi:LmbE family N-acetylglucosaminyl deacetylase
VVAHPDDESFRLGAVLASCSPFGSRTALLDCADGKLADVDLDALREDVSTMIEHRTSIGLSPRPPAARMMPSSDETSYGDAFNQMIARLDELFTVP